VSTTLVDSNVLLDIATEDARWGGWSAKALKEAAQTDIIVINPIVFAEVSIRYERIEEIEDVLPATRFRRDPLPYEAAFLAGKAFRRYRDVGGTRATPMADFYIGAHAAVANYRLLTRDATRYRTYFPTVDLIAP
jgi:predicted nucleic acid-binding protein